MTPTSQENFLTRDMAPSGFCYIPRPWIVYQSLLCAFGVANISSIETLPLWIRVTSLLYHVLVVTCTAPLFFMYYLGLDWGNDVFSIIERITLGLNLGQTFVFGFSSLINCLCGRKIRIFLRDWENYKAQSEFNTRLTCVYTKCQRMCYVIVLAALVNHIYLASAILPVIDQGQFAQEAWPFLGNNTTLLKIMGSLHVYTEFMSRVVLLIMILLYSNVIYALASEFVKLRENISNMSASSKLTACALASSRSHYEELAVLVKQCNTFFTWILGSAMIVQMFTICSSLYMIITSLSPLFIWLDMFVAAANLCMLITPVIILTNAVSKLVTDLRYGQLDNFTVSPNVTICNHFAWCSFQYSRPFYQILPANEMAYFME